MGLNVAHRVVGVGRRESEIYPGLSYPVYQAQLKWIKPGWPIRHKLYILHGGSRHPTMPPFLTKALSTRDRHSCPKLTSSENWQYGNIWWNIAERQTTDIVIEEASSGSETIQKPQSKGRRRRIDQKPSSRRSGEPSPLMLEPEARHWLHMTPTEASIAFLHTQLCTCSSSGLISLSCGYCSRSGNCPDHRTWGEPRLIHATANCHQHLATT